MTKRHQSILNIFHGKFVQMFHSCLKGTKWLSLCPMAQFPCDAWNHKKVRRMEERTGSCRTDIYDKIL